MECYSISDILMVVVVAGLFGCFGTALLLIGLPSRRIPPSQMPGMRNPPPPPPRPPMPGIYEYDDKTGLMLFKPVSKSTQDKIEIPQPNEPKPYIQP